MDLTPSPAERELVAEARAWLADNVPAEPLPSMDTPEGFEAHRAWERRLYEAGWAVLTWPAEYGGREASVVEWLLFEEEYHRARAPGRVGQNGVTMLAPLLLAHGTPEQRERFLVRMARGDDVWVQGW